MASQEATFVLGVSDDHAIPKAPFLSCESGEVYDLRVDRDGKLDPRFILHVKRLERGNLNPPHRVYDQLHPVHSPLPQKR